MEFSSFIKLFIDRPVMSIMLLFFGIVLGLYSLPFFKIGLMPNTNPPGLTIVTEYPGVSSKKIESMLTKPIEEEVSQIGDIKKILSQSKEGESRIDVIFNHGSRLKIKMVELQEAVEKISFLFPREVQKPVISPYDPSDKPVFILSLSSEEYSLKQLREIADKQIKHLFSRIEGVSEVIVSGGYIREITIEANPLHLISYQISLEHLIQFIQSYNIFIPAGKIAIKDREKNIIISNKFSSIEEISNMPIPYGKDFIVPLHKIAEVSDGFRERENISKTNGQDRVSIYIQKTGTGNALTVSKECKRVLDTIDFPEMTIEVDYDRGAFIEKAIDRVESAIVLGGSIAMLVLWFFTRSFPITFIIGISIPASVIITFFFLFLFNVELNIITLAGLALGTGMLIDNAIVVTERVEKNFHFGLNKNVLIESVHSVSSELIASSLTTMIVFIPLIFSGDSTQLLYKNIAITISVSLFVSLVFSLTILPSLIYQFRNLSFGTFSSKFIYINVIKNLIRNYFQKFEKIFLYYVKIIFENNLSIKRYLSISFYEMLWRKAIYFSVLHGHGTIFFILVVLVLGVFSIFQAKSNIIDPSDSGEITASVELDVGTNLQATENIIRRVEQRIKANPKVKRINSKIEKWHATIYIKIKEQYKNLSYRNLMEELESVVSPIKSAFVYFTKSSESSGSEEMDIHIYGPNINELKKLSTAIAKKLKNNILDVKSIVYRFREGKPSTQLHMLPNELARANMSVAQLGQTLRTSIFGAVISKYYDKDHEVDVRLRLARSSLSNLEKLNELYITKPQEGYIPLSSLSNFRKGTEETKIYRMNKRRRLTITVRFSKMDLSTAGSMIDKILVDFPFRQGYYYEFGDSYKQLQETNVEAVIATLFSLLLIYALLCILFESFTWPLLIILTAPFSIVLTIIVFVLTGVRFNISVYIGFILTGGLVVNNSILVVSSIITFYRERSLNYRSIFIAVKNRVRPIIMSTLTTILGMTPMLFDKSSGSELWRPLSLTLTLGISFSIFISLFLIPVLFRIASRRYRLKRG